MSAILFKNDELLQRDVMEELRWDMRVQATDIGVAVKDHVVTLTGRVGSWARRDAAEKAAHRVYGVLDVANELEVELPGTTVRDDADIARQVRMTLQWDVMVPDERIRTTVANGTVTLEGDVDTWSQWEDTARSIRNLAGVRRVINKLTVKPPSVRPEHLKAQIADALTRHATREASRIDVTVSDGIVTLTGPIDSWADRQTITGAVRGTRGVVRVQDQLRVVG